MQKILSISSVLLGAALVLVAISGIILPSPVFGMLHLDVAQIMIHSIAGFSAIMIGINADEHASQFILITLGVVYAFIGVMAIAMPGEPVLGMFTVSLANVYLYIIAGLAFLGIGLSEHPSAPTKGKKKKKGRR